MKIGILSRNRYLYSTRRLNQAARRRGHTVLTIDTLQAARQLGLLSSFTRHRTSRSLPRVDAVIPRIGASITVYGVAVVQRFEADGAVTTATSQAIAHSRDKLRSLHIMEKANLPTPKTILVSDPDEVDAAVAAVDGPPVVIKILQGTQGRGVILASNLRIAHNVTSILFRHGQRQVLVQEFIEEAGGKDLRLLIVGETCVAAMQRTASAGDFRANLHRGATSSSIVPNVATEKLALQAAAAHGIGVAGVDLIPSQRGPLLLEVNSSPGLEGIEATTSVDVATEIVRYLEREGRNAGKLKRKRKH